MLHAVHNRLTEWSFSSGKAYPHPFREVTLDVVVTDPRGVERIIPAFWAGDQTWSVRYAPLAEGEHRYLTVCSDTSNPDLHGREGVLIAGPYEGDNTLLRHGALEMSSNRRHLQHRDGKPFFWLADTWWMGLCNRLEWPDEFKTLTADRVEKGFSVIQIVAGLYPDMPAFDPRGANEAGFPWDEKFEAINPDYFDMADLRIAWLVRQGLLPCIVGCWGYFLDFAGMDAMKRHWRNLVARYAAYPVVWCLAGEATMPYYRKSLANDEELKAYRTEMSEGWAEIARYVRELDPYHHPVTIHPIAERGARQMIEPQWLDLDMLQTGHGDRMSIKGTMEQVEESYAAAPVLPVVNGEVCYEGILEACREEMQRFYFWTCILSGACGHSYGANGLWQLNRHEQPYGLSPIGTSYSGPSWDEASQLPGSRQVGLGKQLLERYEWWRFEPHPEWTEASDTVSRDDATRVYGAGIAGEVRVFFIPAASSFVGPIIKNVEPDVAYRAFFFDPRNGQEHETDAVEVEVNGDWSLRKRIPSFPAQHDWVLVMERVSLSRAA